MICDDANKTTKLEKWNQNEPNECLKQVFDNFINKKPQDYAQNWNELNELLDDVKHVLSSCS